MTAVHGQASVEYAGLLALAAVLGAALALIAGPTLVDAVRDALATVLSRPAHVSVPVVATAADIADVQSALLPTGEAITPDAALLALRRRHGDVRAAEVADALLLAAARRALPWVGGRRTYRAWARATDGPYKPAETADGDRDVENPTAAPVVVWITVAAQRRALAAALTHRTSASALALDAFALIPGAGLLRTARAGAGRAARVSLKQLPQALGAAGSAGGLVDIVDAGDDGNVPAGMRAGDLVIAWPVHRTFWRKGREDLTPRADYGGGLGSLPLARDYVHVVFLRPGVRGLAIVAEGFGA